MQPALHAADSLFLFAPGLLRRPRQPFGHYNLRTTPSSLDQPTRAPAGFGPLASSPSLRASFRQGWYKVHCLTEHRSSRAQQRHTLIMRRPCHVLVSMRREPSIHPFLLSHAAILFDEQSLMDLERGVRQCRERWRRAALQQAIVDTCICGNSFPLQHTHISSNVSPNPRASGAPRVDTLQPLSICWTACVTFLKTVTVLCESANARCINELTAIQVVFLP